MKIKQLQPIPRLHDHIYCKNRNEAYCKMIDKTAEFTNHLENRPKRRNAYFSGTILAEYVDDELYKYYHLRVNGAIYTDTVRIYWNKKGE